jgi:cytochrome b
MDSKKRIWDPIIRTFHWSVAVGFLSNYFLIEEGSDPHEWVGYYILFALGVRLVWGFIGPTNARFSSFIPTASGIKEHLWEIKSGQLTLQDGHNPVGALMVYALLGCLLGTGVTGWMLELDAFWGEDWAESLHEFVANATFSLVLVHVSAVVLFSIKGPANLIKQMVTGRQEVKNTNDPS